jgi:uncharacterized membrane protein
MKYIKNDSYTDDPQGMFYYNPEDNRIFIPNAFGWTLNFARRRSFLVAAFFAVAIINAIIWVV